MSSSTPIPGPNNHSRVIHLDAGQARDRVMNVGTMVAVGADFFRAPFKELFRAHYPAIRAVARAHEAPGLAVIAIHARARALAARAWLAARADGVASAIIGRHSEADVLLEDPAIALRHLAIVVTRARTWDAHDLTFEIIDLRTGTAFRDERGQQLETALCDGPAMISCGSYALFLLQTGDPSDWPSSADDAWSMLPERVMRREQAAEPDRWRRGQHRSAGPRTCSSVTGIPGLVSPEQRLIAAGEAPVGQLHVRTATGGRVLRVGDEALSRGILLGRYARCDGADLFTDHNYSRAHVLVKRVDDRVYAIDTASTEGVSDRDERRVRSVDLDRERLVLLGPRRAVVQWDRYDA
jgi:hypothetical protein